MHRNDDDDDDQGGLLDLAMISEARRLAAQAVMLLEHPKIRNLESKSGSYRTADDCARLLLQFVERSERCSDAEEFDVLLNLIRGMAEGLGGALSLLRIP